MLSNVRGPSDENDRSREPLLGALAGFAFLGLVLFTLHQSAPTAETALTGGGWPEPPITTAERAKFTEAHAALTAALDPDNVKDAADHAERGYELIDEVLANPKGGVKPLPDRLAASRSDPRVTAVLKQAGELKASNDKVFNALRDGPAKLTPEAEGVRAQLTVFLGNGHMPARNVENLGVLLYSEHLLAVEMAGTLLARRHRRGGGHRRAAKGRCGVISLWHFLAVGATLFALGVVGFLTRRNLITMFLSAELMVQGVVLNFLAFGRFHGTLSGQAAGLFAVTVAACEAGLAMALFLVLYRRGKTLDSGAWQEVREPGVTAAADDTPLPAAPPEEPAPTLPVAGLRPPPEDSPFPEPSRA